jgi:hypothetical protein
MKSRNCVLARDLTQILGPLGNLPVIRNALESAPGEKGTSSLCDTKAFLGKVFSEFRVVPVIAHEIDERCDREGSIFAPWEKRGEGIDRTVRCDKRRRGETLSDGDRHKGELLCGGDDSIRCAVEGNARAEFFPESDVEG